MCEEVMLEKCVKRSREESDDNGHSSVKQRRLTFAKSITTSQNHVDELIADYIMDEMKPLRTVETRSFKALITGLIPSATVMCRETLKKRIKSMHGKMMHSLNTKLEQAKYVCTTADLWSSSNRSFFRNDRPLVYIYFISSYETAIVIRKT